MPRGVVNKSTSALSAWRRLRTKRDLLMSSSYINPTFGTLDHNDFESKPVSQTRARSSIETNVVTTSRMKNYLCSYSCNWSRKRTTLRHSDNLWVDLSSYNYRNCSDRMTFASPLKLMPHAPFVNAKCGHVKKVISWVCWGIEWSFSILTTAYGDEPRLNRHY
jgi:hypothetical protein